MAFAKYAEARILGTLHGSSTVNVLHFGTNNNASTPDLLVPLLTQLAQDIIDCVIDFWLPAASSDWTLEGVDVKELFPVGSDPIELSAPLNSVGTRGPVNASFECVVWKVRTGLAGKRKRGRHFMAPPGDADITNSVLSSTPTNDFMSQFLNCMATKFTGAAATTEWRMGVLSRKQLQVSAGDFNASFTEANQFSIEQRLSSLRSRKLGVGG